MDDLELLFSNNLVTSFILCPLIPQSVLESYFEVRTSISSVSNAYRCLLWVL